MRSDHRTCCYRAMVAGLMLLGLPADSWGQSPPELRLPNVVLIFVDNFGYGDLGCYGSRLHRTPHVDSLASSGTRFTSFYVASGVCTPSRAALMTGCYPVRLNLHQSATGGAVLQPVSPKGLNPQETTIAELLRPLGYATACLGKWHLGDQPEFLPTRQGFDEFFGIPYSDDMTRDKHPDQWPELPLLRGEQVIEAPVDRNLLVRRTTEAAVSFIERHQRQPFFLYIPHTMPGSTQRPFASPEFQGRSQNGPYGDAVEELDWSTGQILSTLRRLDLEARTLVIWTSDNGAVRRNPPQGSCAPLRGYGYDTSEGAMRMPCLIRWPGQVPAGKVNDALWSSLDVLPTLAALAGSPLPQLPLDGHDVRSIWQGTSGTRSPWDDRGYCYYLLDQLQAIRAGEWKLYLPLSEKYVSLGRKTSASTAQLFNVRTDLHEDRELSAEHPDVVARLLQLAEQNRRVLGDRNLPGTGQRPAGQVAKPRPLVLETRS